MQLAVAQVPAAAAPLGGPSGASRDLHRCLGQQAVEAHADLEAASTTASGNAALAAEVEGRRSGAASEHVSAPVKISLLHTHNCTTCVSPTILFRPVLLCLDCPDAASKFAADNLQPIGIRMSYTVCLCPAMQANTINKQPVAPAASPSACPSDV